MMSRSEVSGKLRTTPVEVFALLDITSVFITGLGYGNDERYIERLVAMCLYGWKL
jgi:hypothetical protein